jgi:hypothetical protein
LGLAALGAGATDKARHHFEAALELETRIGAHVLVARTQRRLQHLT